ncbi:MAG: hypothetical protein GX610_19070 [Rhodococcus sp.]|nr:hypothetical protein [Rhodococcus sp. (in: high G+C Gram-positive bacteria)]
MFDSVDHARTWHHGPVLTPAHSPVLTRRSVMRFAAASTVGVFAVSSLAACSDDSDDAMEVDRLTSAAKLARRDAENAKAAIALLPDRSGALTTISTQRREHADALEAEIARAAGTYADGSTPTSTGRPSPETTKPAPPPDLPTLRGHLTESQRNAAELARSLSGYRAGLCASIGAACGTHVVVLLP